MFNADRRVSSPWTRLVARQSDGGSDGGQAVARGEDRIVRVSETQTAAQINLDAADCLDGMTPVRMTFRPVLRRAHRLGSDHESPMTTELCKKMIMPRSPRAQIPTSSLHMRRLTKSFNLRATPQSPPPAFQSKPSRPMQPAKATMTIVWSDNL